MAEAIRRFLLKLFWFAARAGTSPAISGWRRSSKRNDLGFK